jgi:hypothetical protein
MIHGMINPDVADLLVKIGQRMDKEQALEKYQLALQILVKFYNGEHPSQVVILNLIGRYLENPDYKQSKNDRMQITNVIK